MADYIVQLLTNKSSNSIPITATNKAHYEFLFPGWSPGVTNGLMVVIAAASVLALVGVLHVTRVMNRGRGYKVVDQS